MQLTNVTIWVSCQSLSCCRLFGLTRSTQHLFGTSNCDYKKEIVSLQTAYYKSFDRYDLNLNLRKVAALGGWLTQMYYDPLDRLKSQTDAADGTTVMQYDALDQVILVRNPRDQLTSYSRDAFGQLWSESSPDSGVTTHQWITGAQRISSTLSDGTVRGYFYDGL